MGCMEWMKLQKKKQGQTNFFEIHLTLLHIFFVLFHSDTWMSLGGTRTYGLFKLDFVRLIFSIFFHIKYYSPCLFGLKICIIYIYLNY